jgi:hypothetical protein
MEDWRKKDDARRNRQSVVSSQNDLANYLAEKEQGIREIYSQNFPQSMPQGALEQRVWLEMLAIGSGNQHGNGDKEKKGNGLNHSGSGSNIIVKKGGTVNIQNNYYGRGPEPLDKKGWR